MEAHYGAAPSCSYSAKKPASEDTNSTAGTAQKPSDEQIAGLKSGSDMVLEALAQKPVVAASPESNQAVSLSAGAAKPSVADQKKEMIIVT